ncbi:PIN domain-containing protein [Candidatus Woesearchaeota archaeon]|nr:PIN domain-containing protein [Candidatus Woesearchaeota archaeon]
MKYYIDACIWRDYFENRSDKYRPLGDWALTLIKKIIDNENDFVIYSDLIEDELLDFFTEKQVFDILSIVPAEIMIKVKVSMEQFKRAKSISRKLKIPLQDTVHAIVAAKNNSILVTRDKHFYEMQNIVVIRKQEDLI